MKKYLITALLLSAAVCFGQNVRYSAPFPSISNVFPYYLTANVPPNSPVLAVCSSPANQVPCTNYVTTFTSLGVACHNGAQDTPDPNPSACQSTGDSVGNIAFWIPAGTYDYTVCISNNCFGPYTITIGISACPTCVTSTSPGVGIAHFAGSTQNVTSSAVDLSDSDVINNLGVSHLNGGTGATSSTFWRGDGTWQTPAGAGTVTGTGTTGFMTEFAGSTVIANGPLFDSGISGGFGILTDVDAAARYELQTGFAVFGVTNQSNTGPDSGRTAVHILSNWQNSNCVSAAASTCTGLFVQSNQQGTTNSSANLFTGISGNAEASSGGSATQAGYFHGGHFDASVLSGSLSTVTDQIGLFASVGCGVNFATTPITSLSSGCANGGSASSLTVTNSFAGKFINNNETATTNNGGLYVQLGFAASSSPPTSTSNYGLFVDSPRFVSANSVATHMYGLYIADQTVSGTGTNSDPWGVFEAGTAKNQFGGALTVPNLTDSALTPGNCVQAGTAGILTTTGSACGAVAFSALIDSATVTWALASASYANNTLTFTTHGGSRTLNITNPVSGGQYTLKLVQDATGGEGLTLGTGCTWKVSGGGGGAITPTSSANAVDVLTFIFDGTNCLANFSKNFS